MTEHSKSPAPEAAPPLSESAAVGDAAGGSDPTWKAPWVANPESTTGAAQPPVPPQTSTGHYGPGYTDTARHYGDTQPGQPDRAASSSQPSTAHEPAAAATGPGPAAEGPHGHRRPVQPDDPQFAPPADRPPDIGSDEVGVRPPDRAPSDEAPASENAALIFERS